MAWNGSDQTASGAHRSRGRISAKCATPGEANFCSRQGQGQDVGRKTSDVGGDKRQKTHHCRPTFSTYFLLLLLLLALAGAAVWYFLLRPAPPPPAAPKSNNPKSQIKQSTPAPARTNRVAQAEKPKEKPKPKPYWEQPTTNGLDEAQIRKWEFMHRPPPGYTNTAMATSSRPAFAIFKTRAENEIACLISIQPGASLMGTPRYSESFKQEFLKSCETPILVSEDDDEYTAQLKRDMNNVKIEIRGRMAEGEDLGDILTETRRELRRLSEVKRSVEADMREMIRSSSGSEADVDACVAAANKLLESKGIAPVKLNPITRRVLTRTIGEQSK